MLPTIDCHQHLWDLKQFRLPWTAGVPALNKSFLMKDYLEATRGLNIVKTIYMEVDLDPAQQKDEAAYVIELCKNADNPTVAGVISGRPATREFYEYIRPYRDSPYIKGVRQVLHVPDAKPGLCLEATFVRGVRQLGALGMRFDVCMRVEELDDAVRLAELCPDTPLMLDHCGNADPAHFAPGPEQRLDRVRWERDISQLAKCKNVYCKISGMVAKVTPGKWKADDLAPIVNHCLDEFGSDRVVFGGDWPVCTLGATLAEWVTALRAIIHDRSETDQRKLLHDNAVKFYGLA